MIAVSSYGVYEAIGQRFVAVSVGNSVCITVLGEELSGRELCTDGDNLSHVSGMPVIQRLEHIAPFTCVWSDNSAHLVIVTDHSIFLYKGVTQGSNQHPKYQWEIERTVEAPRDLTQFHAGYSHPLLSLEHNAQHSGTIIGSTSELVVINLLCSLFQTFNVANVCSPGSDACTTGRQASRSSNKLSYSGRYLTTAQLTTSTASTAVLGLRVYDLQDLWVLEKPAEASYLDFKYSDLPLLQVVRTGSSSKTTSAKAGATTESGYSDAPLPSWDVMQLQWKPSDGHSLGSDHCELLFVSQLKRGDGSGSISTAVPVSIGIADSQEDFTYEAQGDSSSGSYGDYSDVTVSIYAVFQQPDYENIAIMTMAYNAAIVAGQLNEEYSHALGALPTQSGRDALSGTVTPNYDAAPLPYTTTISLLTVVSLSALFSEPTVSLPSLPAPAAVLGDDTYLCWAEPAHSVLSHHRAGRVPSATAGAVTQGPGQGSPGRSKGSKSARRHTLDGLRTSLQLGVQYRAHHTDRASSDCSCVSYALVSVRHTSEAVAPGHSNEASGVDCYTAICVGRSPLSTLLPAGTVTGRVSSVPRCWGLNAGSSGDDGNSEFTFLSELGLCASNASEATGCELTLFHKLALRTMAPDAHSTSGSGLSVARWGTLLITSNSGDSDTEVARLLPSANARLMPVFDSCSSLYQVSSVRLHGIWCPTTSLVSLAPLSDTGRVQTVVTATVTDTTESPVQYLYLLYRSRPTGDDGGGDHFSLAVYSTDRREARRALSAADRLRVGSQQAALSAYGGSTQWNGALSAGGAGSSHHPTAESGHPSSSAATSDAGSPVTTEYSTAIQTDPHFGLGIRIDVVDGRTVVSSFKKHPITGKPMSAQAMGVIHPGDEFVAINGLLLRGRTLPEVIHAIRSTVSEVGEGAVTLTMRRTTLPAAIASASAPDLTKGDSASQDGAEKVRPVHPVSSATSLTSTGSYGSLSDGLGSGFPGPTQHIGPLYSTALPTLAAMEQADGGREPGSMQVPMLAEWKHVHHVSLGHHVVAADIALSTGGPDTLLLVTLVRTAQSDMPDLCLSEVSVAPKPTKQLGIVLTETGRCSVPVQRPATLEGSCVQLWTTQTLGRSKTDPQVMYECTVLLPTQGLLAMPLLLQTSVRHDPQRKVSTVSNPAARSLVTVLAHGEPPAAKNDSRWSLFEVPKQVGTEVTVCAISGTDHLNIKARLRYPDPAEHVPYYLPAEDVLSCHIAPKSATSQTDSRRLHARGANVLTQVLQLLKVLPHASSTSSGGALSATNAGLLQHLSRLEDGTWAAQGIGYSLSSLASEVMRTLVATQSGVPPAVDASPLDAYSQRAIAIQRLLAAQGAPLEALSKASAANLVFADTPSQQTVLQQLLTSSAGATESTIQPLLRADTDADILMVLTSLHAQLWLRDLSPLFDVIYKQAMATFKRTKSSIQVFLELVLIGREDTLLQLAKTDREKSGKQLLALLTLDDTFTSDKVRKSLHKNAFALMKLRRYRDAAAAFLLADPPYLKEACSVLSKQHGQPMLALLIARVVEHRLARRGGSSGPPVPVATVDAPWVLAGSGGHVLGHTSRQLLQADILPGLTEAAQRSTLRAAQAGAVTYVGKPLLASAESEHLAPYRSYQGIGAAVLCLVCALWLQDRSVLSDTLGALFGRYTLVDGCIRACTGGQRDSGFSELLATLGAVDWLVEVSAYISAKDYSATLQGVQELLTQLELHGSAQDVPRYLKPPVLTSVLDSVRGNAFLQYCKACFEEHNRQALSLARPPSVASSCVSPSAADSGLFCISEGSSAPDTPAIMTGTNTPTSTSGATAGKDYRLGVLGSSVGVAALGEALAEVGEDTEFAAIMKKLSRFQALSDDGKGTSTSTSVAESTDTPAVPASASEGEHTPPRPKAGGFNFASMARPAPSKPSTTTNNLPTSTSAPSALDAFDAPGPPPRRPAGTTAGNLAPSGRRQGSRGASLDLLSDATDTFPPPVRPVRSTASTPSLLIERTIGSSAAATSDGRGRRERGGASLDLLGDATDMVPPLARHTRPGASTPAVVVEGSTPVAAERRDRRERGGASLDLLGDATDLLPPPVRPVRSAASTPALVESTVGSSVVGASERRGGRDRGGASLDLLDDATDMLPPPARHTRSGTRTPTAVEGTAEATPGTAERRDRREPGGASLDLLSDVTDVFPPPARRTRPSTAALATAAESSGTESSAQGDGK